MTENLCHFLLLLPLLIVSSQAQKQEASHERLPKVCKERNAELKEQFMKILMIGKRSPLDQEFEDRWPGCQDWPEEKLRLLKRSREQEQDQENQEQKPRIRVNLLKRFRGGPSWYVMLK